MARAVRGVLALFAWSFAAALPAAAQSDNWCEAPGGDPVARPAFSFVWENDAVVGPDRDYSNGVGLIFSTPRGRCAPLQGVTEEAGGWLDRAIFDAIPGLAAQGRVVREAQLAFGLAHQIYTPEDLTRANPDPADRPYAAWAYYSAAYIREMREADPRPGQSWLGHVRGLSITRLDVGIVGPSAQGEAIQRGFHDWIDADVDPQGWDYQIKDEPGLVLRHERKILSLWDGGLIDYELEWNAGLALGNVMTHASTGLGARIGYNLGLDYGPPRLRPGLSGANQFRTGEDGDFSVYLFGGAGVRAVARNIFLDGNTFADSRSVEKKHFVADYQFGAALVWGMAKIAVTRVHRTEEFVGQRRDSVFDSLAVSFRF